MPATDDSRDMQAISDGGKLASLEELAQFFHLGSQGKRHYSAFGVARFDREAGLRVPIHTLSGLLHADHLLPSLDYDTLLRATSRMTGDEREVAQAFARAVFNVALHNRDDHARNFAWRLGRDGHWCLAPAFDLTYSPGPGPGGQHTMTVAGEGMAPGARHLMQVAASAGLAEKTARQVLERVRQACHALLAQPGELADDLPIRKTTLREWLKAVAVDMARLGADGMRESTSVKCSHPCVGVDYGILEKKR